jgi:dTDP-4-dehydrorhamnose reductase
MRILVFGQSGQVANAIRRLDCDDVEIWALGRNEVELTQVEQCAAVIADAAVDIVINAAAFTEVDLAETREDVARLVNANAPGEMARACALRNLPFIHISTDYVFDGSNNSRWREDDPTVPLNAYGRSKLAGEQAIRSVGGKHVILRTSGIYSAHGKNFVKTMLQMAKANNPLAVINDQYVGPTWANDVASTLVAIAKAFYLGRGTSGTFHYCGSPAISWHGFAKEIFEQADWLSRREVHAISSSDRSKVAIRPQYAILDCTKIRDAYKVTQPDWRKSLKLVVDELKRQDTS